MKKFKQRPCALACCLSQALVCELRTNFNLQVHFPVAAIRIVDVSVLGTHVNVSLTY